MIYTNNHDIIRVCQNNKEIEKIYHGLQLVWNKLPVIEILSCFALGYWVDEYLWTDDETWTD